MKIVKIPPVQYTMLCELAKKYRMKVEDFVEEMIQEVYDSKKRY